MPHLHGGGVKKSGRKETGKAHPSYYTEEKEEN